MTPLDDPRAKETNVGHMLLDKEFQGDLAAKSMGHMLASTSNVKGSAGYVAIERVTGTLHGKSGSFSLLHRGMMDRGTPSLSVDVIPDSGTGELSGLTGSMTIERTEGTHRYVFDYALGSS